MGSVGADGGSVADEGSVGEDDGSWAWRSAGDDLGTAENVWSVFSAGVLGGDGDALSVETSMFP